MARTGILFHYFGTFSGPREKDWGDEMVQLVDGDDSAQGQMSQNLEEIAAYLHDILEERHSVASNVRLLTEVLDSIKRELAESSADKSANRPAA